MAREQFVLGQYDFSVKKETPAAISLCKRADAYVVSGAHFSLAVSKKTGELSSYELDGRGVPAQRRGAPALAVQLLTMSALPKFPLTLCDPDRAECL